ncbi:MAG TPA: hypothetical protein VFY71_14125 [Planctomycetota bacterium]|nr:hypothetical protein [Planctomycetota bacterium]
MARAAGALLVAALCAAPGPVPGTTLTPLVTITGRESHVTEARCLRVTSADEWAALWLEHVGEPPNPEYNQHKLYFNKAGLPVVDFERCLVVAVFRGAGSNCAGVSAVAGPLEDPEAETKTPVAEGDEVLRLSWHSYQSGTPADSVSPFGFFVLPRNSAPLVVQDRRMPMGEGHGRIEERARFPALAEAAR